MNSEITTGTEFHYRGSRRRRPGRRRRRLPVLPVVCLLVVLAAGALLFWRTYGDLYRDRYQTETRIQGLLREETPDERLKPFAADLAVVQDPDDADTSVGAESAFLAGDSGGNAVFAKNAFQRMNPASTTKIMTCLIALENLTDLNETWTAGGEIAVSEKGASMAGIREGDTLTAEQVLYALMLKSGADAANMLALHVGGSEEKFVEMMNARAEELGASGTHFTNCHGLTDENHYTTAYDLYLMLREAMKSEEFRKLAGTAVYEAHYTGADGKEVTRKWKNTNLYLTGDAVLPPGFENPAGKTGTTLAAGSCLALAPTEADGSLVYSIVLKSLNHVTLYEDMNVVLEKINQSD